MVCRATAAPLKVSAYNTPGKIVPFLPISSPIHSSDSNEIALKSFAYQPIWCRIRDVLDSIRWNLNAAHGEIGSSQEENWAQIRNEANFDKITNKQNPKNI